MQGNSVTIATSAEQIAVCEAIADWADARDTTGLVRAELDDPADRWRTLWPELAELGVFAAAADEGRDGLGAPFADVAAMLAECGRRLVPGPLAATVAAAVAVSRTPGERAQELTADIIGGALPVVAPADHVTSLSVSSRESMRGGQMKSSTRHDSPIDTRQ